MRVQISTAIVAWATLSNAISFRSEVHGTQSRQGMSKLRPRTTESGGRDEQDVLGGTARWDDQNTIPEHYKLGQGLPIENLDYLAYTTDFGIGTSPPQLMRAYVDLAWSDLVIPAVNCTHCAGNLKYDRTKSPSFKGNGTEIMVQQGAYMWGKGEVSLDTVTLSGGIEVPHHPFVEAEQSSSGPWAPSSVDSVLGLSMARPFVNTTMTKHFLSGILETMVKEKTLDHNVFSLLLPRGDGYLGDLMFGDFDKTLFEGELSTHSLYPDNSTDWAVEATSASVAYMNGTEAGYQSLAGYSAILSTTYPWIGLPRHIAQSLINATGADCSDSCTGCEVPCDQVAGLPELTLILGGYNFTVGAEDYVVKTSLTWPFCKYQEYCTILVEGSETFEEPKRIVLGSSFLKSVYSVFDFGNRAVKFAKAKHRLAV